MMRLALIMLAVLASVISVAVLSAVIGAFADPTSSLFAVLGSMVWATFGPFLVLAAVGAWCVGIALRVNGMSHFGGLVLVLSTAGMVGAGFILTRMVVAANAAGADINLRASFMLGEMQEPSPEVVETVQIIEGLELRAAMYLPPSASVPAPVIVYIHGGGFIMGTNTETAADLRWFADKGWLVVSIEYRLFRADNPTWDKAPEDVKCALAWTFDNVDRFGGDPTRLALLGDSAGGNLAINTGFAAAAGGAESPCGTEIPVPMAIAVQYPAVDPMSIYEDGFPIPGFEPRMLIEGYIGGSPDQYPERVAAVSSATFLNRVAPPTLVILPEKDSLVVASGTLAFARDAQAAGIDLEVVRIPFANHIFNQIAANSLGNQIGRTVRLRFLEQHVR